MSRGIASGFKSRYIGVHDDDLFHCRHRVLLVVYQKVFKPVPMIRVGVSYSSVSICHLTIVMNLHILHAAPQTRLQSLRVPSKEPHNTCPTETCKYRPRSHRDSTLSIPNIALLHAQLSNCKHHSCKDIYHNLLIDA
jgi:hypothetical protein